MHVTASLAFVWVCKKLIDAATSGNGENVPLYIGVMIACMLMQILLSAVEQRILNLSDILLKNKLRYRLFNSLMESRWNGKETFHTGDTLNRVMEDVRVVSESITKSTPAVMTAGIQFVAAFLFLFILEPGLAWAIPGIMLAMLIVSRAYVRRMRKLTKDIRTTESSMQSLMQESLQHRLVIHTLERTPYISGNLAEYQEDLREQVMDKTGYSIFTRCFIQLGFSAGYASAFLWGVFGIMNGTATFGMMTAFLQLVGQIQRPIMNLSRQLPPLINSITSAERLEEIERQPLEESGEPQNLGRNVGIRFSNVDYTYPDSNRKILDSCNHDFKPGSTTALIGETGAGKSTMMRLMLALLEPDMGEVVIYNENASVKVSPQTRCNIVYVPQGNTLMSGTIRENLLLGDPSATDGQLKEVLYLAAADFVSSLPDGLDTLCGERGSGLSEGQAQRIAIARALLRKGGVLLLDEPTSALDTQTEETLIQRLTSHLAGRTMIIVTHRDATAALCQNVLKISA
jgi:ABC-type multidrug transport system fused ATPase/permease subunit